MKPADEEGSPKQGEFNMAGKDDGMSATIVDALQKRFTRMLDAAGGRA